MLTETPQPSQEPRPKNIYEIGSSNPSLPSTFGFIETILQRASDLEIIYPPPTRINQLFSVILQKPPFAKGIKATFNSDELSIFREPEEETGNQHNLASNLADLNIKYFGEASDSQVVIYTAALQGKKFKSYKVELNAKWKNAAVRTKMVEITVNNTPKFLWSDVLIAQERKNSYKFPYSKAIDHRRVFTLVKYLEELSTLVEGLPTRLPITSEDSPVSDNSFNSAEAIKLLSSQQPEEEIIWRSTI